MRNKFGFVRVAAAVPELKVADVDHNLQKTTALIREAARQGAEFLVFPELGIPGYSCGDLFAQRLLLDQSKEAVQVLARETGRAGITVVVGLPFAFRDRLYNCAAVLSGGKIRGLVPKQYLPNSAEYYERRWFTPALGLLATEVNLGNSKVTMGTNLLFADDATGARMGVEICEDLWAVQPPSGNLCLAGANLILNPSASNEILGKASYRRELIRQQSARALTAYAYTSAGPGESSTDVVFSGHAMIAENGMVLAESRRFAFGGGLILADVDLDRLAHDRRTNTSFSSVGSGACLTIPCTTRSKIRLPGSLRPNPPTPFVPTDPGRREEACREIFSIQSAGLAKRLRHTGARKIVLGISGGLDSTLALLVAVHTFDQLGIPRKGILAVTMPGFGTTDRTRANAEKLARMLGVSLEKIPIRAALRRHFRDIRHPIGRHDLTFENAQARERTQILMDLANREGGFVLGTGDLSEAALGWCTFNGDHMSMYHVNIGVPKTLVRYLIDWCADAEFAGAPAAVLHDISATPISPELLPVDRRGRQRQKTEDTIGPYELHDYFLYQIVRFGVRPAKVAYLAGLAFSGKHDRSTVLRWLEVFLRRFISQQFKRSAMPDGPKVGTVALSPRGDWRMPSDAEASAWLRELAGIKKGREK
jgi:NAD+ synthase (glutamine-hydrolysing)